MIEKIAVARALNAAKPGEASVKGIAKPVNEKSGCRQPKKSRAKPATNITCEYDDRPGDAQRGQRVWCYGLWHAGAKPVEKRALGRGENIVLDPDGPTRTSRSRFPLKTNRVCHRLAPDTCFERP